MRLLSLAAEAVREAEEIDHIHRSLSSVLLLVAARQFQANVALFLERITTRMPA